MIDKIRFSKGQVSVGFTKANNATGDIDRWELKSKEAPAPDFNEKLQALKPHVLSILELTAKYGDGVTVTGLTITANGDGRRIVIVAKKDLVDTKSPFNLATPIKPDSVKEGSDDADCLSTACVKAIDEFLDAVQCYLDGNRQQQIMSFKPEGETEEEEEEAAA